MYVCKRSFIHAILLLLSIFHFLSHCRSLCIPSVEYKRVPELIYQLNVVAWPKAIVSCASVLPE